ncbi:hypothetical protein [Bradyrhizobium lablabi]|uniref:hypothetical protein n=1 Tax=Bradyrhizobium lablabi TaxID=722472 RepID=UPI001BAC007F|nr:hypothetical protein [Bradyrhizobium lablabi]MBR0694012.1 hypothetical protein [Bradyrhizobium lablabi]
MEFRRIAAAATLTVAMAAPAFAQDPAPRSAAAEQQRAERMHYQRNSGFWPADVAAGVVGGAIGTAGAIAAAPFRNDAYAYSQGYYNQGFVCQPGTWFRGADGRRHICQ